MTSVARSPRAGTLVSWRCPSAIHRCRTHLSIWLCLVLLLAACGYRPVRSFPQVPGHLAVRAGTHSLAEASLMNDALFGARSALAREGILGNEAYPRVEIELLRVDERSSGIAAPSDLPLARGMSLGLVGRAFVYDSAGAPARSTTGDVRVSGDFSAEFDLRVDTLRRDDALRSVARKLGETLIDHVLGTPAPHDERL